jgi:hypothetical protein
MRTLFQLHTTAAVRMNMHVSTQEDTPLDLHMEGVVEGLNGFCLLCL